MNLSHVPPDNKQNEIILKVILALIILGCVAWGGDRTYSMIHAFFETSKIRGSYQATETPMNLEFHIDSDSIQTRAILSSSCILTDTYSGLKRIGLSSYTTSEQRSERTNGCVDPGIKTDSSATKLWRIEKSGTSIIFYKDDGVAYMQGIERP